jgi:predicted chitinase
VTENGWPPDTCQCPNTPIPLSQCVRVTIPGTSETLWFQQGAPATILPAFMADMNEFVEPMMNAAGGYNDEGCWTATNSVPTSNHLGGSAIDYNWNDHPMGPEAGDPAAGWKGSALVKGDEVPAIRKLLAWYEGTVFWGNDWQTPKDSMHFQMGYKTYDPDKGGAAAWVEDFIARKIRPDGFSRYRRGSGADDSTAQILAAATGLSLDRATELMPAISAGLSAAQCTNVNRIAMFLAQCGHESDGFNTTEEYQCGDTSTDRWKYKGRSWIQVTWRANYSAFGRWAAAQGLIESPDQFVDDPESLADLKWAGVGAAWYWITPHPGHNMINDDCDSGDIAAVTYTINGGYLGLDDRTRRWKLALKQGDALLKLINVSPEGEDWMSRPEALDMLKYIYDELSKRGPSRSFLAPDQIPLDTLLGFDYNIDGNAWDILNVWAYLFDVPYAVERVEDVANNGVDPDSWAAGNPFVAQFGQAFCKGLMEFKASLRASMRTNAAAPQPIPAPIAEVALTAPANGKNKTNKKNGKSKAKTAGTSTAATPTGNGAGLKSFAPPSTAARTLMPVRHTLYTVNGYGATWDKTYPADMARAISDKIRNGTDDHWWWQPVSYGAKGIGGIPGQVPACFPMQPSIDAGVAEMTRLMLQHPPEQTWGVIAYSEGSIVTSNILDLCGITQSDGPTPLAAYKDSFVGGVHFGGPRREKGHTCPGGIDPGGHGIVRPNLKGTPDSLWEFAAGPNQTGLFGYKPDYDLYTTSGHVGDQFTEDDEWAVWELIRNGVIKGSGPLLVEIIKFLTEACHGKPTYVAIFDALKFFVVDRTAPHWNYHQIAPIPGDPRDCWRIGLDYINWIGANVPARGTGNPVQLAAAGSGISL